MSIEYHDFIKLVIMLNMYLIMHYKSVSSYVILT